MAHGASVAHVPTYCPMKTPRHDSNARRLGSKPNALSTELRREDGTADGGRTRDLLVEGQVT